LFSFNYPFVIGYVLEYGLVASFQKRDYTITITVDIFYRLYNKIKNNIYVIELVYKYY